MNTLNGQIKEVLDRQSRVKQRKEVTKPSDDLMQPKLTTNNPLAWQSSKNVALPVARKNLTTPKSLSKIEVKKMQDAMQFNIYTQIHEEEQKKVEQVDTIIEQEAKASEVLKKDLL